MDPERKFPAVPCSITLLSKWWDQHFYSKYAKPAVASDEELERVYLQRKRFLFEHFGEFGIGEEHPARDGKFVNVIMKWCLDFIPYLLGVKLTCLDEGFWYAFTGTETSKKGRKKGRCGTTGRRIDGTDGEVGKQGEMQWQQDAAVA
ncbi:MAG: hypothetical protein HY360_15760, partial [Verrucomicrobia bacterium]|nr:hypothetical protein [Verrucomicrobiota bacterium]